MKKKNVMITIINFMSIICGVVMKLVNDTVMVYADEHGPTETFYAGSLGEYSSTMIKILLLNLFIMVALIVIRKIDKK